jgi:hypothetical protein
MVVGYFGPDLSIHVDALTISHLHRSVFYVWALTQVIGMPIALGMGLLVLFFDTLGCMASRIASSTADLCCGFLSRNPRFTLSVDRLANKIRY